MITIQGTYNGRLQWLTTNDPKKLADFAEQMDTTEYLS